MSGRKSRDKGLRFERQVVQTFQDAGFASERIPLSGSAGGSFSGDVSVPVLGVDRRIECKKRAAGYASIYAPLADHWALIVAADRKPPLVVLRLDQFIALVQAAEKPAVARQEAA